MTILEAITTAIENLEGIRLSCRDADTYNRVRTALILLDALRDSARQGTTGEEETSDAVSEVADA